MYSVIFSLYVIKMYKEWIINEVRKIDSSFIDWKSLLMLNDKKHFAACSKEKNITIYDISNNCKCEKEIVKALAASLPKFMWPNKYVHFEQLPMNKNSKIDRVLLKEKCCE